MKELRKGSKKIKLTDFMLYEKKNLFWKKISKLNPTQGEILQIFARNNNLALIMEDKIKDFVKGHIDPDGNISGTRIKHTPNGKKLARGGYSIFAKHLTFNTNDEFKWDICYQNTSGTKTYLYTEDKVHLEEENKYKLVKKFENNYDKIIKNLEEDIKIKTIIIKENISNEINENNFDMKYIALYILIKSFIRVGNYDYYKKSGHKGLTTLQKKDLFLTDDNYVRFNFIGKDGIPQDIIIKLKPFIIQLLRRKLDSIGKNDFVFTNSIGNPLHSSIFSDILFKYTNEHFYPHIIRSFHADKMIEDFIEEVKKRKEKSENKEKRRNNKNGDDKKDKNIVLKKEEIIDLYKKIAKDLGHKKFNKKTNQYEIDYKVTLSNYIYPKLREELESLFNFKK